MAQRIGLMTIDDFIRLYDTGGPFELIDGERIALSPTASGHSAILMQLIAVMIQYQNTAHLSESFAEAPFVVTEGGNWVKGSRVPDLMIFLVERLTPYKAGDPDWKEKPFLLVPDIAVEIISANDLYVDVEDKVKGYLSDGVRSVWVINPRRQDVTVYRGIEHIETVSGDNALTAPDILPRFSLPLPTLFA
jgi:Uma2 family endonuclease